VIGKQLMSKLKPRPPLKNPEEKKAPQLKNLRLRTASEGRPYKCEEEGTHPHKTACGHPVNRVCSSSEFLETPEAAIHGPGAGRAVPCMPATRTRMTVPKQGEGTCSLAWISALPSLVRGTAPLVAATISEHATLAETAVTGPAVPRAGGDQSNINAQAAVIGESRERVFYHPWCSATWYAGESDARIRSSDG
jgi:hypothetical protein